MDDRDFDEQMTILNSELQGEDFTEQLLTNIAISKKLLFPLISCSRNRANVPSLVDLCAQIRTQLPRDEQTASIAIGRIEAVISQFVHVKNIFSQAGGLPSLEVRMEISFANYSRWYLIISNP